MQYLTYVKKSPIKSAEIKPKKPKNPPKSPCCFLIIFHQHCACNVFDKNRKFTTFSFSLITKRLLVNLITILVQWYSFRISSSFPNIIFILQIYMKIFLKRTKNQHLFLTEPNIEIILIYNRYYQFYILYAIKKVGRPKYTYFTTWNRLRGSSTKIALPRIFSFFTTPHCEES